MRLASFNMRAGGSPAHWDAILEVTRPDLLFVQETKRPSSFLATDHFDPSRARWASVEHGRWGSAVFSAHADLKLVTLEGLRGWVVGSPWESPFGPATAWSVHLPPEGRSYIKAAHNLLDLLEPTLGEVPVILAGDWNFTVGFRLPDETRKNKAGELELLERLKEDFGVQPAWATANPDVPLPQTLRWARDPTPPYHCDGIFLPTEWCSRIVSADVLHGSPWTDLSDHNPVVVELE